ncbi:MAG: fibronectin type III domain-containing protein [Prevotellaceae bacterium]|jgi:hypothetical protein|nr:fibronectin type III domain-containing protein [Prevotellaceae bacterium]
MTRKKYMVAMVMILFAITACDKNELVDNTKPIQRIKGASEEYALTEYNIDMKNFALVINQSIQNKNFRILLKDEAYKQVDGAFDVLISSILETTVPNSEFTVRNLLNNSYRELLEAKKFDANFELNKLYDTYPELQVSIPIHLKKLADNINDIPPVTFITEEYQTGKIGSLFAFNGKYHEDIVLDGIDEPDFPVIVIGLNERMYRWNVTMSDDVIVPTPQNLTATATTDGILLMWEKSTGATINNTTGYHIERKEMSDNDYRRIHYLQGVDNVGLIDPSTITGKTYLYRVRAVYRSSLLCRDVTYSQYSNIITVVGPPRPNAVSTFSAIQTSTNHVELNWTNPATQYGDVEISRYKNGMTSYDLIATLTQNDYHYFDTDVHGGDIVRYAIQNVSPTGRSIPLYDYEYVSYRNPAQISNVKITKIKVENRGMEPWGMGPPEFVIALAGGKKTDLTTKDLGTKRFDFNGTDLRGWDREQYFNRTINEWFYDVYEGNYDVLTIYIQETDKGKLKKLDLTGNVGVKAAVGINNGTGASEGSPNLSPFSAGVSTENTLAYEFNFVDEEDMGFNIYYYFEPVNKIMEFNGANNSGKMKVYFGQ